MPGVIFNALRDAIYHSMNDRGVYLPDDYNSDAPPAQVSNFCFRIWSMKLNPNVTSGVKEHFWFLEILSNCNQGAPVPVDMRLRVLQVNFQYNGYYTSF